MDLRKEFSESGQFWLASDSERESKAHGSLELDELGIATLRVFSSELPSEMSLLHPGLGSKGPVRVVGITESNKNVTIDQASPSQGGFSFGPQSGTHRRSFISDKVIIGQLYDEASPIELRRVAFEIEGAFEWFGRSGFVLEESSTDDFSNVAFRYEAPTPINFQVDQEINGQVFFGIENMSTPAPWSQKWSIVQLCSIVLTKSGTPWTFADINQLRLFVQSFCSLVTGYPGSVVKQTVFVEKDNGPDAKGYRPLYYPYRDYESKFELPENVHPHQMSMSFAGLEASFEGFLERWWQYCRENEPAVRQVMVSRFGELAIADHFVAQTKALEASVGKDLGKRVHFVKVVEHLASTLTSEMDGAIDVKAFSEAVRDYRNWFTHFDRSKQKQSVDYSELRSLTYNLSAMIDVYMLQRVLPSEVDYKDVVYDGNEVRWALRQYLRPHVSHLLAATPVGRADTSGSGARASS